MKPDPARRRPWQRTGEAESWSSRTRANCGGWSLNFLGGGPFYLVLLYLNLPILTGVEVCRQIKCDSPEQPLVICSAAVLDVEMSALRALGVEQFLSKPYHPAELVRRINDELRGRADRGGQAASRLESAGWWLDRPGPLPGPSQALFKQPAID